MASAGQRPWKRPESVLVVVHTDGGRVLLLRRREPAGFWQSVTGSLEWGEEADAAAARELAEETGIRARPVPTGLRYRYPIVPPWRARYDPAVKENLEHVYHLRLPAPVPVQPDPREHLEAVWLPREEAAARVFSATNREAIRRLAGGG